MAIPISKEEFEQKFGVSVNDPVVNQKPNFIERLKQSATGGFNKAVDAFNEIGEMSDPYSSQYKKNPVGNIIKNIGKAGSGATQAITSPITAAMQPVLEPTVGAGINYAADKISNIPAVQKFASSKAGQVTSDIAQGVSDYNDLAGFVAGSKTLMKAPETASNIVSNVANKTKGITNSVKNVANDVIPSTDRIINSQVTKALDLTQGDVSKIAQSTGNEVGRFLADNNLIQQNKQTTMAAVKDYFDQNYTQVRSEINRVRKPYKPSEVPRYTETLKAIQKKIDGVPGMQETQVEVAQLLGKKGNIKLADVQRVKELLDEHFNLYKSTGDVGEGVAKQGLDNVRTDLKKFIEQEVKDTTGADIGGMNNNVATAKGILDSVEARSTRGLTRSNIRLGDFGTFGIGATMAFPVLGPMAPVAGIAAVFLKRVAESPAVQLRIAKYLDRLSDAKKAAIKSELEAGNIPAEFGQFVKGNKTPATLSIDELVSHEGAPDLDQVNFYRSQINRGEKLPPLKVVREANGYGIEDGKHRFEAYRQEGVKEVPVEIMRRIKINNYQSPRFTRGAKGRFTGSKSSYK